jgi:hypothetical protein
MAWPLPPARLLHVLRVVTLHCPIGKAGSPELKPSHTASSPQSRTGLTVVARWGAVWAGPGASVTRRAQVEVILPCL